MQHSQKQAQSTAQTTQRPGYIPVLLIVYLIFLVGLAVWSAVTQTIVAIPLEQSPDQLWLVRMGRQLAATALRDLLLFFPLGFLLAGTLALASRSWGVAGLLQALIVGVCVSLALALALRLAISGLPVRRPTLLTMAYATVCCGVGCWAGATWVRSASGVTWLLGQTFLLICLLGAVFGALAWFGTEPAPADFTAARLTTEDRRRLASLFERSNPRKVKPGETARLTLTETDLNQLLAWGLSLVADEHKARVELAPGAVAVAISSPLPRTAPGERYLNVTLAGDAFAEQGRLGVSIKRLRIGRIEIPEPVLRIGGPSILHEAWENKHTRPFLTSMKHVQLDDETATLTYGHVDVSDGFLRDALVDLGGMENMAPVTAQHVEHLIACAERAGAAFDFGICVQSAFDYARQRSPQRSAVQENRAAILALGFLVGHYRIRTFVGPELRLPTGEVRSRFAKLQLRKRNDWARHFTVSAALVVLANVAASDAVGLLKEELDADGGSGFSFADLAADRAGTTFGQQATANDQTARAMQRRLGDGFHVDAIFPPVADLPEGLTDQQLQAQFGGVEGERFEEMMAEIERRIAGCAAYRGGGN